MSNNKKLTAAALAAFAIASTLGAGPAAAAVCDGSWHGGGARSYDPRTGDVRQAQCYYLPTVSNGRVTGLEFKQNFRWVKPLGGAVIGGAQPPRYR
jgi:hypothetical protein